MGRVGNSREIPINPDEHAGKLDEFLHFLMRPAESWQLPTADFCRFQRGHEVTTVHWDKENYGAIGATGSIDIYRDITR